MHMKQEPGTDLVPTGINLTGESLVAPVQFRYFGLAHSIVILMQNFQFHRLLHER